MPRYHVLFVGNDRPEPRHLAALDAPDDDHARRLLAERWPGDDDLFLVRVDGLQLVRVPEPPDREKLV
jgi:hypothetical protein